MSPSITQLSEGLGLRGMSIVRLTEIEEDLKIDGNEWKFAYSTEVEDRIDGFVKELFINGLGKITYLRYYFWSGLDPFSKIKTLKENISILSDKLRTAKKVELVSALEWLLIDLTTLFSVALLEATSVLYLLPDHQRESYFESRLVAGKMNYEEKERLVTSFYNAVTQILKAQRKYVPLKREELRLIPEYSSHLYQIMSSLVRNSQYAIEIPRLLDVYGFSVIGLEEFQIVDFQNELKLSDLEFEYALKFSRDIVDFLYEKEKPDFLKKLMNR
jgi:hypothetical protein